MIVEQARVRIGTIDLRTLQPQDNNAAEEVEATFWQIGNPRVLRQSSGGEGRAPLGGKAQARAEKKLYASEIDRSPTGTR